MKNILSEFSEFLYRLIYYSIYLIIPYLFISLVFWDILWIETHIFSRIFYWGYSVIMFIPTMTLGVYTPKGWNKQMDDESR